MQRRPVSSSNIASLGWEDGTLEIEYRSGHLYEYALVPEGLYQAALGASSVGKFVAGNIVDKFEKKRLK